MAALTSHLRSLRRVFQTHEDGCGIACLAMLAGLTYEDARFEIFGDTPVEATSLADLRWGLMAQGFGVPNRMTPFWEGLYTELPCHALLAINPMPNGMWHWAAWDAKRRRILDPLRRPARHPVVVGYLTVAPLPLPRARRLSRQARSSNTAKTGTADSRATP